MEKLLNLIRSQPFRGSEKFLGGKIAPLPCECTTAGNGETAEATPHLDFFSALTSVSFVQKGSIGEGFITHVAVRPGLALECRRLK